MKNNKILHIFLTIALVFTLFSPGAVKAETTNSSSNFFVTSQTKGSTTSHYFEYNGGSYSLYVVTKDNETWTATTSAGWITTSKKTGRGSSPAVTISVTRNNKNEERSGKVTFSTSKEKYVFYVKQGNNPNVPKPEYGPANIFIPTSSIQVSASSQTLTIGTGANYAWTATSDREWIYFVDKSTSYGSAGTTKGMYIGIKENTTSSSRVGHITIKSGNDSKTITFTQAAKQ